MDRVLELLVPLAVAIVSGVTALIGVYFSYLVKLAQKKIDQLETQEDKELLNELLYDVDQHIQTAVARTNQILVDDIKQNGLKLTDEQKQQAYVETYKKVMELIGEEAYDILDEAIPNFESWIEAKIEATVKQLK